MSIPIQVGVDLVTLGVAIAAGATWFFYDRRRQDRAELRELKQQQHTNEDRLAVDRAEAAALHNELTSMEATTALSTELTPAGVLYLTGLHERVRARYQGLKDDTGFDRDDSTADATVLALLDLISAQLDALHARLPHPVAVEGKPTQPAKAGGGRDFSKYYWNDGRQKEGKYAVIALIGAKFANLAQVKSRADFEEKFAAELALALKVDPEAIDRSLLLDEMNHAGQRERYAQTDRKWKADYGDAGVVSFDGKDYRTAWNLGMKGGQPAQRQVALINYFRALDNVNYPIKDA